MPTPSKQHARAERLREHGAAVERARCAVAAMGLLVRGREARARDGEPPLEMQFANLEVDGRALPAAVWVALRRDDVNAAIDAMTAASQTQVLIEEREVMGAGYRLESVADTLLVPEPELLMAQLSRALEVPLDVLTVIAEWGPDDPRCTSEIDDLLTSRFGPADRGDAPAVRNGTQRAATAHRDRRSESAGHLTMTVADAAQLLRLDDDQIRALTSLVRNARITLVEE